jgi:hypothetical protein
MAAAAWVRVMPAAKAAARDRVARRVAAAGKGRERRVLVGVRVAGDSTARAPKVATTVGVELRAVP